MNRREFFKMSGIGIASTALIPTTNLLTEEIPLYKQFVWINNPVFVWVDTPVFPLKIQNKETQKVETLTFVVKTQILKIRTPVDIDYTEGNIITEHNTYIVHQSLFNEVKSLGYTHLYSIGSKSVMSRPNMKEFRSYYVRGVIVPSVYTYQKLV
jgi:hypothetical protein